MRTADLNGNNTFSGGVDGPNDFSTIVLGHNNSLGSGTFRSQGIRLRADVPGLVIPNAVYVLAGGFRYDGNANITFAGPFTANDARTYENSGAGTITLDGDITTPGKFELLGGTWLVNGPISGTGPFEVESGANVTVTSPSNTYGATTLISSATLSPTANGALSTGAITLSGNNAKLLLTDGVTISNTLNVSDSGNNKVLQIQAGEATYAGQINVSEAGARYFDVNAWADQTLCLTGKATGTGGAGVGTTGDGTIVFNGSEPNTFTGSFKLGDDGSTTWDGSTGGKNGFVVFHRADFAGAGRMTSYGSQLQAGVPGLVFTNGININQGGLRLGGTNDFELSGDIRLVAGDRTVGNYGLEGVDVVFSGDVSLNDGTPRSMNIQGSDGKDNGSVVFDGVISGTNGALEVAATFDGGDVTLSGANTFNGQTRILGGTLHISQEANLGANPTNLVADQLQFGSDVGTLHTTASFAIDDTNRGITLLSGTPRFSPETGTTLTIANPITGPASLTKVGGGTLVLSASNTYTGATQIEMGTLAVAGGSAIADAADVVLADEATSVLRLDASEAIGGLSGGGSAGGTVDLQANTLTVGSATDMTFAGDISGSGNLVKTGAGVLELTGANTLTGTTTISDGAALGGEGSVAGQLILGASTGATIVVDGSNATAAFSALGGLDVSSGTQVVVLVSVPAGGGTFSVLNYSGTLTGDESNFKLDPPDGYRNAVFATNANAITLTIGSDTCSWDNGTGNRLWDLSSSANWTSGDNLFKNADSVGFGNTGVGAVTISGSDVAPGSVTFSNAAGNAYALGAAASETLTAEHGLTVAGSGDVTISNVVAGATLITHAGSGTLTLAGANTFTGGVTVESNATVRIVNNSALGSTSQGSVITVEEGGTFEVDGNRVLSGYGPGSFVISGAGVGGTGALVNATATANNLFGDEIAFDGDTTINTPFRFEIDGDVHTTAAVDAGNGVVVTKTGSSALILRGDHTGTKIKAWTIDGGTLQIVGKDSLRSSDVDGLVDVTVNAGVFDFYNSAAETRTYMNDAVFNGGSVRFSGSGGDERKLAMGGDWLMTTNLQFDVAKPTTFSGTLSGTGTVSTVGDNALTLDFAPGANDFVGDFVMGDTASSTWDGANGGKQGFVVANSSDAMGSGTIFSQGSQLQAGVPGINITNHIVVTNGGFRMGGANDFELSGDIELVASARGIGNYGLEGLTIAISGDMDLDDNGVGIEASFEGTEGKDNGTFIVSGAISDGPGDATIELHTSFDDGLVVFTGTNDHSGLTAINAGTLQIGDGGTAGTLGTGNVEIANGTLALNRSDGITQAGSELDFMGGATNALRAMAGVNEISGGVSIDVRGTTVWTADAGAELHINNNGSSTNIGVSGFPTLRLEGAGTGSVDRKIAAGKGDANVIKTGSGTWTLNGQYIEGEGWNTGGLEINDGTLVAGAGNVISWGSNKGGVTVDFPGTLDLAGGSLNINGLSGSGQVDQSGATPRTLTVGHNNATSTFSGTILDSGSGTLSLIKTGGGTLTLSGVNTYDGTTTVSGGALMIAGDSSQATGAMTVQTGGALGGGGSYGGDISLETGSGVTADLDAADYTLNCGDELSISSLDINDCAFTITPGTLQYGADYVLISADSTGSISFGTSVRTIADGINGRLVVENDNLILRISPRGTYFMVR